MINDLHESIKLFWFSLNIFIFYFTKISDIEINCFPLKFCNRFYLIIFPVLHILIVTYYWFHFETVISTKSFFPWDKFSKDIHFVEKISFFCQFLITSKFDPLWCLVVLLFALIITTLIFIISWIKV